jgi:hypothetical protein
MDEEDGADSFAAVSAAGQKRKKRCVARACFPPATSPPIQPRPPQTP